ncbi:hypothetical protein LOTGIDRAFT_227997 [Lottia gigantea]|uniref:SMP-30/Gluconolactonase/LRE-like region domain-containing protein n=1 Tax=Lottia gigantea TaxID=225164 RepID=V4BCJ7_LOTGI|nr:hypothetical protein LOTGIDRAFT_227997 [Lottia gigantea]ESP05381.1 hypothetical protein LOTGIDRAFT_227997 [Lottia gigantea]
MALVQPEFTKITSGIVGSEGPVFDKTGTLYVVAPTANMEGDKFGGQVLKVDIEQKQANVLCLPVINGDGGAPAGCQCDKDGNIMIADMRLGILKVQSNGHYTQICQVDDEGNIMQGCNDCHYDYYGNLWVTAPAGKIAPHPYTRSMEEAFGSLYCLTTEGEVKKVATDIQFPNGLAVQHDSDGKPKILVVAETPTKLLLAFDITSDNQLENRREWGKMPGDLEGGADGMDFDEDGNLLVAHWGSGHIEVFGPDGGKPRQRIKCPFQKISNLHFVPKSKTVYVTEHDDDALWKFTWERPGKPQYCEL